MASVFKTLLNSDIATTRTLLHESIPLTGSISSGTYSDNNIKNYSHGMFQSVHDYPYLSSSANHIFDITAGYSPSSPLSASTNSQNSKKINIYNQMAQVLAGYDETGAIQQFDEDGNIIAGGTKLQEVVFINFARLLTKDEIKKGSFNISFHRSGTFVTPTHAETFADTGAANDFKANSPAGEYGILKATVANQTGGLIFYQAGIAVLTASIFADVFGITDGTANELMVSSSIQVIADGVRNRLNSISFNNTTELNSTIYFCRINHNDYNYSSNPTYLNASKIRVKNTTTDSPVSYFTGIGLYSADNELLATAKISEPIKVSPDTSMTLRVRLDY